jgi:hypothetical protein
LTKLKLSVHSIFYDPLISHPADIIYMDAKVRTNGCQEYFLGALNFVTNSLILILIYHKQFCFVFKLVIYDILQVSAGGGWRGAAAEHHQAATEVHSAGAQVWQPGAVHHVAAPGAARGVQKARLQGAGLCHQDSGGAQRGRRPQLS